MINRQHELKTKSCEDRPSYQNLLKAERECLSKAMFERLQREARRYSELLQNLSKN
jgi:hypothetical protein